MDANLFEFINGTLSNSVFDALLPWCREKWFWAPVYLFVVAFILLNEGKRAWWLILGLVVTVALADTISSKVIKKQVQRLRPCQDPVMQHRVIPRVSCGSGYSFTSSHATNHFAVATFLVGLLGYRRRWIRPVAYTWASLIAFSQVYVGVHYPLDVFFGALLGMGCGGLVWWGFTTEKRRNGDATE
jgi:membrane-associated phospholipid phosphatase